MGWYCSYLLPRQALTNCIENHDKTSRQSGKNILYCLLTNLRVNILWKMEEIAVMPLLEEYPFLIMCNRDWNGMDSNGCLLSRIWIPQIISNLDRSNQPGAFCSTSAPLFSWFQALLDIKYGNFNLDWRKSVEQYIDFVVCASDASNASHAVSQVCNADKIAD